MFESLPLRAAAQRKSRKVHRAAGETRAHARRRKLRLEVLERRDLLATLVWDGGGTNSLWSNPLNWVGDVAPQQDDRLMFPSAANETTVNDFAAGTRFRSITISDAGYVMNENAAGANKITLLEGFAYNATASGAQFNIPITLGASQTFFVPNAGAQIAFGKLELANLQSLTLDGRGNFDVEGVL